MIEDTATKGISSFLWKLNVSCDICVLLDFIKKNYRLFIVLVVKKNICTQLSRAEQGPTRKVIRPTALGSVPLAPNKQRETMQFRFQGEASYHCTTAKGSSRNRGGRGNTQLPTNQAWSRRVEASGPRRHKRGRKTKPSPPMPPLLTSPASLTSASSLALNLANLTDGGGESPREEGSGEPMEERAFGGPPRLRARLREFG